MCVCVEVLGEKVRMSMTESYAELIAIHSMPENRSKGYGRKMMDFVLSEALEAGFEYMVLWTFEENFVARRFYEGLGFCATDRRKPFKYTYEVMYEKKLR